MVNRLIVLATRSTARAVELAGDGVGHVRQLLLLLLKVLSGGSGGILLEPFSSLLDGINDLIYGLVINQWILETNRM